MHDSIFKNNEVYRKHGVKLGKYVELNHNLRESPVLIMPPSLVNHNIKQVLEFSLHKRICDLSDKLACHFLISFFWFAYMRLDTG